MEYQGIYKIGGIRIVMSNFISNKIKEIKIDSDDYLLIVLFANGITKVVDFKEKLKDDMYLDLKNKVLFAQAKVDAGGYGVSWNDDIDISEYELWNIGTLKN